MCIGATFALLEIRLVLAMLLQRFRLHYQIQTPVERLGTIVLGPKHGMPMQVHRQDRQVGVGVGGVRGVKGGKLGITATSSAVSPTVSLEVVGFGAMTNLGRGAYNLNVVGVDTPPDTVTIRSSLGGSIVVPVTVR
jgi:hypothetical protein